MAIKKSELYSSLWAMCDELRGGMDASQYKDYVLTMLFIKYVSDKYGHQKEGFIKIPEGATFEDMAKMKYKTGLGDHINKKILKPILSAFELDGKIETVDFNDDDKLGSGKEQVDRLSKLIGIFENPNLNFKNNRAEDDDILGDAYEYLMRNFATESGKSKGQFYTPAEVSRILAQVIEVEKADAPHWTAYDPTCGSGSLLLKVADNSPKGLTLYGQEKDNPTKGLAIMNFVLHGYPESVDSVAGGNTISNPKFIEDGQLKRFDFVVANPPFSNKNWTSGIKPHEDEFNRFQGFGVPPEKNGDYAFLLHILKSLKSTGKAAVILPHGVLFRGNVEADIRENIVKRKWIKGIIGLPANLFYGTGIPACIIVIDKEKANERKGIFMVDASKGFIKDGNKNRLREQDIHKITDVFNRQWEIDKYSRLVKFEEIEANDYNLNIPRYIDTQEEEDIHDLNAHLNGGIPQKDIDKLSEYWQVYPNLRKELFEPMREGYSALKLDISEVSNAIFEHPEFTGYRQEIDAIFQEFVDHNYDFLNGINEDTAPKDFIRVLSEDLLERYSNRPLINRYDVYQHLMDYWKEIMKDDVYLLIENGWKATVERILVKNKKGKEVDKGWTCELVPKHLVIDRYFPEEKQELDNLNAEMETVKADITSTEEEHGSEDAALEGVSKVSDATANLIEYKYLAAQAYAEDLYQQSQDIRKKLEEAEQKLRDTETSNEFELLRGKTGKVIQSKVNKRIKELTYGLELEVLELWKEHTATAKELKKQEKELLAKIDEVVQQRIEREPEAEFILEILLIEQYLQLKQRESDLKAEIKTKEYELDELLLQKYPQLTEQEVHVLVVDDKWLAEIKRRIDSEIDAISQSLTARVKELAERYEFTLIQVDRQTKQLEEKVQEHLAKMMVAWN